MTDAHATHDRLIAALMQQGYTPMRGDDGHFYPVQDLSAELTPAQRSNIDGLLALEIPVRRLAGESAFAAYDAAHRDALLAAKPWLTDVESFIFRDLRPTGDGPRLRADLGGYYDMLATCDALDQEMRRHAHDGSPTPLRDRLHASYPPQTALREGGGRCAVIGVAALLAFPKDGRTVVVLGRRAASLATDPGRYHVLPAFVYQPGGPAAWVAADWSLKAQILREFGEEAFAMPEVDAWPGPVSGPDYFMAHPPVAELVAMLADGRATLTLTGLVMSLLTLRPEVCALLHIHDPDWYPRHAAALTAAMHTERQATLYLPVDGDDAPAGFPDDLHLNGVPQGMAAFWLGLRALHAP